MKSSKTLLLTTILIILSASIGFAQSKKNSRPTEDKPTNVSDVEDKTFGYRYEFSQPNFLISKVIIEHNLAGRGIITFQKRNYDEDFVEQINLSEKSLDIFKVLWDELNFLESDEVYQSKDKEYPHLGTYKLKMKKELKERSTEFNWSDNTHIKALTDEYRRVTNQYVWIFDMSVARENQPLESPKLMRRFDKHLMRNEISDPNQLVPYLKEVVSDERFPLITRNHAKRLVKRMEKENKKDKEKNPK